MSVRKKTKTATKNRKTLKKSTKKVTKKEALKKDGTLKKGYRYLDGGGIVKV